MIILKIFKKKFSQPLTFALYCQHMTNIFYYYELKHTLYKLGQEVGCSFSLFDPISFHDLSVPVNTNVPGPTRLRLTVQDRGVCDIIVLKHTLLKLALRREMFLKQRYTHIPDNELTKITDCSR